MNGNVSRVQHLESILNFIFSFTEKGTLGFRCLHIGDKRKDFNRWNRIICKSAIRFNYSSAEERFHHYKTIFVVSHNRAVIKEFLGEKNELKTNFSIYENRQRLTVSSPRFPIVLTFTESFTIKFEWKRIVNGNCYFYSFIQLRVDFNYENILGESKAAINKR